MKKKLCALIIICSILCPSISFAQDATITPLKQGQSAPYQGVLFSPKAIAEMTVKLDSIDETVKIEVDKCLAESQAKIDFLTKDNESKLTFEKTVATASLQSKDQEINILNGIIKQHENNSSKGTWMTIGIISGFIGGIVVTSAAVYTVNKITN